MKESNFNWLSVKQLSLPQILLAFALPSAFAFTGFRIFLPILVKNGTPAIIGWPMMASGMLFLFVLLALLLLKKEADALGIGFSERTCLKKISLREWIIYIAAMLIGLALTTALQKFSIVLSKVPFLAVPDYFPFFLNPEMNPMKTDISRLSPGFDIRGQYWMIPLMAVTLLLNILTEEFYFRAWLLPKMISRKHTAWILNGTLFAFYHSFQLWLLPQILPLSLIMAFVVFQSKSVLPALTIHLIVNSFSVIGFISLILS